MRAFAVFMIAAPMGVAASASEATADSYSARGRLISVGNGSTANDNAAPNCAYDKADGRTIKSTTGTTIPPPP